MANNTPNSILLVRPGAPGESTGRLGPLLTDVLEASGIPAARTIRTAADWADVRNRRILFVIELGPSGINLEWLRILDVIRSDPDGLSGCVGAVIVDGPSELYTKSVARELVLAANLAGCLFPGRPLAEGTGSLYNFHILAKNQGTDLMGAYRNEIRDLLFRLLHFEAPHTAKPNLLVLHASIRETSNTFLLWSMVREELAGSVTVREISLQNGAVNDCVGCPFTTCMHFVRQGKCFYGGVVVDEVYPAIGECDGLLVLCPNYNDALSANISASINRLTALYRRRPLYDKYLYGIVVSGYSGSDIVASQLISSLNMNKTMILPPRFAMLETANDPQSILKLPGIRDRAQTFARSIRAQLTGGCSEPDREPAK